MTKLFVKWQVWRAEEDGAVATEYALLLVLIALAIVAGAILLGGAIADRFTDAGNCIDDPTLPAC